MDLLAEPPRARFEAALARGSFELQRCSECGTWLFYPRVLCSHCGAADPPWFPVSGRGVIYSTTAVHEREGDRNVSIVELDEGPRMMSSVIGVLPSAVFIGMPVVAEIDPQEQAVFFRPEER